MSDLTVSEPPFLPQEIIRAKRDGLVLPAHDIEAFIAGLTQDRVTEGQAAAFAMAVLFRGLDRAECAALTGAMARSGEVLRWDLPGPVLDKHSTGGIGDAVSLVLAPLVAACGGFVPMISGRGLGHTGGTLDKLDSIPGYRSQPDIATLRRVVRETGCAIIGQTPDLAPADRRLYAIRDVTATVESIDLITASILSKKLAAGLDGLVMDVKTGSGAFMTHGAAARALAERLIGVGGEAGLPITALVTDMDQPLASAAGNALEIAYVVAYFNGRREPRFHAVTVALAAEMLLLGGLAPDRDAAETRIAEALASGRAAEIFARMVAALGGPADLMAHPDSHLSRAPVVQPVLADRPGFVAAIDTRALGVAIVALGGGRTRAGDAIDHAVGLSDLAGIGDAAGERPLALVHARSGAAALEACRRVRAAYQIAGEAPPAPLLIQDRLTPP